MNIGNSPHITNYKPPTITRGIEPGQPQPEKPAQAGSPAAHAGELSADETRPAAANPLAALFNSGYKPAQAITTAAKTSDNHPALGRFVDVLA